jgi:hypothetical protein
LDADATSASSRWSSRFSQAERLRGGDEANEFSPIPVFIPAERAPRNLHDAICPRVSGMNRAA